MTPRDPFKDAFDARSASVSHHVDVDAGLTSVQRRAAVGAQIRQGAMAALVVVAMVAGGFALAANRGDDGSDVAIEQGDDVDPATTVPPSTVAPVTTTTIGPTTTTAGGDHADTETSAGATSTAPAAPATTSPTTTAATTESSPTGPTTTASSLTDDTTTTTRATVGSSTTSGPTTSGPPTTVAPTTTAPTTTVAPTTTAAPTTSVPSAVPAVPLGSEVTVDPLLWRVVNVNHNDELNVRRTPDAGATIVGSLAPAAIEVTATGRGTLLTSGATWYEVVLDDGTVGWVNAAFLDPMNGGTSFTALPCLLSPGANLGLPSAPFVAPNSGSPSDQVLSIGQFNDGFCDRVVITLDGDGFGAGTIATNNSLGVRVELPQVTLALQGHNAGGLTYVIRDRDSGGLYAQRLIPGGPTVVTYLTEPARIVIDRGAVDADIDVVDYSSDLVIVWDSLTKTAPDEPATLDQPATIRGIARPFEAQLGVGLTDAAGNPVSAQWSGGINGTTTGPVYGVMTSDWISAWGEFEFSFAGLSAGDHVLVIEEEGGDDVVLHEIPFTVEP